MQEELERELQDYFIDLLISNGYEYVDIINYDDLVDNFKKQLESFNSGLKIDFNRIYDYLCRDDGISKFDKLRNPYRGVNFIDFSDFSKNIFQVAKEVQVQGEYLNRYDVTILINGLPLLQIELKKSGVDLKIAFNQIQRYDNHSYRGLFEFIQVFVISNKVHTRYFFNDSSFDYNSTYLWKDNRDLESFTNSFLIKRNIISFLNQNIFKNHFSNEYLMIRPYQAEIIDKLLGQIKKRENAYVWMSYNTGKGITSLRLAEILMKDYQVIYLVQNHLSKYPKFTVSTKKQFLNALESQNLIITNANFIPQNEDDLNSIADKPLIFIFNDYEKHYHKYFPEKFIKTFKNSLFYCFTSAPVFDENIICERTTKYIFKKRIASYSFKDALSEKNILDLNVEYIDDENLSDNHNLSSEVRIDKLSEIIEAKSENNNFKSILIAESNRDLIAYYQNLKHLKVAPVLRFDSNDIYHDKPVRNYFEEIINEYNDRFGAFITHKKVVDVSKISDEFERDIIKRFKNGEIDLLLVDASIFNERYNLNILGNLKNPSLNTIYLDCVLNYGELFEALSMVNGVGQSEKTQANIVLFRDLVENISKTIKLYSDNHASEDRILNDYDYYLNKYSDALSKINDTKDYDALSNCYDVLMSFDEFDFTQSQIDEFNTYKDKFNHETFKINDSKKIIREFNPVLLNQFTLDLDYIESLDAPKIKGEITDKGNSIKSNSFNEFNIFNNNQKTVNYENNHSQQLNVLNNNQDFSKTINVKNEYHIHIGGDTIRQEKNIHNLDDLIINTDNEIEEYTKICPVCGKKYKQRHNFCSIHDEKVELVNISELIKYCRKCGVEYTKKYNYCRYCDCDEPLLINVTKIQTKPNRYYNLYHYDNSYSQITDLLTPENIDKLFEFNLTQKQFDNIINDIKITCHQIFDKLVEEYNINLSTLTTLDKLLLFSKSFVKTEFKEGGGDLGYYRYNEIYIDDRATTALQITTIIHELSHFLMAEIFEQIVSLLLNTDKTEAVEAFVCYILIRDELNYIVDEYCAHTVEGRFATYGYQDYGSYESVMPNFLNVYGEDYIDVATGIGNTFADYIKNIMTSFIDEKLRNDIKTEFEKIKDVPNNSGLKFETSQHFEWQRFSKAMRLMLTSNIEDITNSPQDMEKLKLYAVKFRKNNQE